MIICRKIQLYPVGNKEEIKRVYEYIRDGIYQQNRALNIVKSEVYSETKKGNIGKIKDIYKEANRKNGRIYPEDIEFAKGLGTPSRIYMKVKSDMAKAKKDGLYKGTVALPTTKMDSPLLIANNCLRFYHEYETDELFFEDLFTNKVKIYIKFVNDIIFEVILGNPHKSKELRNVFKNIFECKYKVCGSSIQLDGTKIVLNLSMDIPKQNPELDENIVVGVDLGIAVPAMCVLNNNKYKRESIGDKDDLFNRRKKLQEQRSRLQTSLKISKGGHGRQRKLKALERLKSNERNYVKTYNHMVSKRVIDFALKNNAKYINVEDLSGFKGKGKNDIILRNWSYYELQQQITYKAEMNGIVVRKINPAYTSQKCSCCGYTDSGNRPKGKKGQAYFKCLECGEEMNADFNAARNIAMSTEFTN